MGTRGGRGRGKGGKENGGERGEKRNGKEEQREKRGRKGEISPTVIYKSSAPMAASPSRIYGRQFRGPATLEVSEPSVGRRLDNVIVGDGRHYQQLNDVGHVIV